MDRSAHPRAGRLFSVTPSGRMAAMTSQADAFATLAAKDPAAFAAVRELAADFFALRDAMVNETRLSEAGKAALAVADAKADTFADAVRLLDEADPQ